MHASVLTSPLADRYDRPLTHRDLDDTPDDGNRYELIDGTLYVSPFPTSIHQHAATALTALLYTHVHQHELGRVFAAGLKVVLDEPTGVGPDVVYVSRERLGDLRSDGFHGIPDLLVEILSSKPGLDTRIKKQKYERSGVPHYWIVDPVERHLVCYALIEDRYRVQAECQGDDRFAPALFPGLVIELSELWL